MLTPTKILIVDDRPENLLALDASLRREDLAILHARSGAEALDALLAHDVALGVLDVQMPDMDGFELAELMRGAERTRHIPIIFLTAGAADQERMFRGYESGAVDFLFKPYDPRILSSKVGVFVELYRRRQELKDALRFSDFFVGMLGHDLRNPLSAILTGAQVLSDGDARNAAIARRVINSARRMGRMIEEILDFTRLRIGGGIPLKMGEADLAALSQTIVEEHRLGDGAKIRLETTGDARVTGDAERILQMLSNLVGNAVQHGRGGEIRVRVDGSSAAEVTVSVRNLGTIAPALLPQIFDPFRRANAALDHGRTGLGLGLYIAEQIASGHHGSITVESDGETTFTLRLPRRQE